MAPRGDEAPYEGDPYVGPADLTWMVRRRAGVGGGEGGIWPPQTRETRVARADADANGNPRPTATQVAATVNSPERYAAYDDNDGPADLEKMVRRRAGEHGGEGGIWPAQKKWTRGKPFDPEDIPIDHVIPARAMRPMDPGELVSKAEELVSSFNPARMTVDAHADEQILRWNVREANDETFLRQIFYGCVRYKRMIDVLVTAFYHDNASCTLRSDRDMYCVYAYLALQRLEELGFGQYRRLIDAKDPQKMVTFVKYVFNAKTLNERVKDEWLKLYDVPYVANMIESVLHFAGDADALVEHMEERVFFMKKVDDHGRFSENDYVDAGSETALMSNARLTGRKSFSKRTTKVEPFKFTEGKPKPLPVKETIPPAPKPKPVPASNKPNRGPTAEQKALAKAREENKRLAAEKLARAEAFKLRCHERPMNIDKVRAEVIATREARLAANAEFATARPLPAFYSKLDDGPEVPLKQTAASILREDALYKKKQAEEARNMESFEMGLRDTSEYDRWKAKEDARDAEERRALVEARIKASEEAFDKALKAKRDAAEANARKVESLRLEALALEEKRASEALRVREENEARRAQVLEERERRDEAIAKLREEKRVMGEKRALERAEAAKAVSHRKRAELARKADLARQIRALERCPKKNVKDAEAERSGVHPGNVPLWEDMSIAELRERLVAAKKRKKEEEEEARRAIVRARNEKKEMLSERLGHIRKVREIAETSATLRRATTAEEKARREAALREKNEADAAALREKLARRKARAEADAIEAAAAGKAAAFKAFQIDGASKEVLEARRKHDVKMGYLRTEQARRDKAREDEAFVEKTRRVVTTTKKKQNAAERKERDAYVERYDARLEQLATENDARAAEESARKKDLVEGRREEEAAIRDRFSTLGSVKAEVQPGGLHASGLLTTRQDSHMGTSRETYLMDTQNVAPGTTGRMRKESTLRRGESGVRLEHPE